MKNLICAFLFFAFQYQTFGQSNWLDLYNESIEDYDNYNLDAAKDKCKQALEIYTSTVSPEDKNAASILRHLALIYYDIGDYEEGVLCAEKETLMLQNIQEANNENFGTALYNLGLLYSANSQFAEAKATLLQARRILLEYHAVEDLPVAEVEGNLAIVHYYLSELEDCEPLFISAIASMERSEEQSPEYANILYTFGDYCLVSGKPKEAIEALLPIKEAYQEQGASENLASISVKIATGYEENGQLSKAAESYQFAINTFGNMGATDHSDYLIALNNLSLLYQREGQLSKAEALMAEVVRQKINQKDVAYYLALANLGNIFYINESYEKALSSYAEVIENYIQSEGRNPKPYLLAMTGTALIQIKKGMYNEALKTSEEAIAKASEQMALILPLLKAKASAQKVLGQFNDAEKTLKEAVALVHNNQVESHDLKLRLASLYTTMNKLMPAGELFEEIKLYYESQSTIAEMQYVGYLGEYAAFLQASSNYTLAESMLLQSVSIKERLFGKDNPTYLSSLENLGVLYLTTGKYSKSEDVLENVYALKEQSHAVDETSKAYTLNNLGIIKRAIGEFGEAEEYFSFSMKKYKSTLGKDHIYYAGVSNELGTLYMKMGNTKAARPLIESSLSTFNQIHGKYHIDYVTALENLASLNYMEGYIQKSREQLEEALEIDKSVVGIAHPMYSKTLHNLASILEELGEFGQASTLYEESLKIYEEVFGKDHPSYANTQYNLAVLKQEIESYEEAKVLFQQVVDLRSEILNNSHPDLAYSYYGLASVKQKTNDYEGALGDYRKVIKAYLASIENYFPSLSEEEKSAFYAKIKPVFEAFQDFAVEYIYHERGDTDAVNQVSSELYDLQLSTKALLLNASNKIRNTILNSGDEQLISKFKEWQSAKEEMVKALNLSKDELERNGLDLNIMQAKSNQLEKEISKMSTAFAGEFDKENVNWLLVQEKIQEDEVAIEILRIKKNTKNDSVYYAALILPGALGNYPKLVVIKDGLNMDLKYFKQYKNMIVFKMEDARSYDKYWKQIDEHLVNVKRVYLSSDGVFNKVNINTLYDTENKTYVFDKYPIDLLSNTKDLLESKSQDKTLKQNTATIFGYPDYALGEVGLATNEASKERGFEAGISMLPGTLEEINNIAHTLDQNFWKYEKFESAGANEVNIKLLNNPKLLHIATHGFFMTDMTMKENSNEGIQAQEAKFNPLLRSGLLLAGAAKTFSGGTLPYNEDGVLTAYEAMNLNLDNTELVVMSACETGLGEVKNGEGVYGLQRSFMVAGVDNLIMSLWKVNDETTQKLMSRFYNHWLEGQSKKDAFRQAILSLKKEYKQPYYWGAFVILGN